MVIHWCLARRLILSEIIHIDFENMLAENIGPKWTKLNQMDWNWAQRLPLARIGILELLGARNKASPSAYTGWFSKSMTREKYVVKSVRFPMPLVFSFFKAHFGLTLSWANNSLLVTNKRRNLYPSFSHLKTKQRPKTT